MTDMTDMTEKRKNDRIHFISMGMVDGTDVETSCSLENISEHGALLCIDASTRGTLQRGDIVRLKAVLLSPVVFQCKVTRVDDDKIAVQFLN